MEFKKIYLTVSVIALTCSQYAVASPLNNTSHIHTQHTLELKPISNSFQTAAAIFLPDKVDGLDFNGKKFDEDRETAPKIDLCSKFPLSSCPANAKCSKCTTSNKFKLNGCNDGFKLSAGTCVAKSCTEINPAYRADIPVNQNCSTINTSVGNCYSSCYNIDLSDDLLDTCPTNYFKSCSSGTTGSPKYTEAGSACYQCKPTQSCDTLAYYANTDGSYSVSPSQKSINLYGQNNTTTIPSGGVNVCWAGWTYPSGATINGGSLNVKGDLVIGIHRQKTTATFNVPVTVNGTVYLFRNSTAIFNNGISGNYVCSNGNNIISCPF